jgi:acetylornithine deacetylase/succinyl-diaminopimelate desuccinylase-like protein
VVRRVSVNFGVVQGGVKINMLPAECVLDVDFRLPVDDPSRPRIADITKACPDKVSSDSAHSMRLRASRPALLFAGSAPLRAE